MLTVSMIDSYVYPNFITTSPSLGNKSFHTLKGIGRLYKGRCDIEWVLYYCYQVHIKEFPFCCTPPPYEMLVLVFVSVCALL